MCGIPLVQVKTSTQIFIIIQDRIGRVFKRKTKTKTRKKKKNNNSKTKQEVSCDNNGKKEEKKIKNM